MERIGANPLARRLLSQTEHLASLANEGAQADVLGTHSFRYRREEVAGRTSHAIAACSGNYVFAIRGDQGTYAQRL
jgi:hypothetical protein